MAGFKNKNPKKKTNKKTKNRTAHTNKKTLKNKNFLKKWISKCCYYYDFIMRQVLCIWH